MVARDLRRLGEDPTLEVESASASLRSRWTSWMRAFFEDSAGDLAQLSGPGDLHGRAREGAADVVAAVDAILERMDVRRADLAAVGSRLRDEVRWRERVLFPALEGAATPGELERLGARWRAVEVGRARSQDACEEP